MPLWISVGCAPMIPPENPCASTTTLDRVVPSPGKEHRAGDLAQRGTTVGIDATQAVPAQAAPSQNKQPVAQPTSMGTRACSHGWLRIEGTPMKIMPRPRHPATTPVELTVSAQQQHKVKTATDTSGDDPGQLIHGTGLPAEGKCLNTPIRAGPCTPDQPPTPPRSTP